MIDWRSQFTYSQLISDINMDLRQSEKLRIFFTCNPDKLINDTSTLCIGRNACNEILTKTPKPKDLTNVRENRLTCRTSFWGEEDSTVERSSTLLRATSKASFTCTAGTVRAGTKLSSGISWYPSCAASEYDSASGTERGGVNIGARLSSSRPGKRIPLDLKLCKEYQEIISRWVIVGDIYRPDSKSSNYWLMEAHYYVMKT